MLMMVTMKMMTMTKIVMIAKLDSVRRFKVVQCPLQPDKDSKLRSNKDEDDDDDDEEEEDDDEDDVFKVVPVTYSKSSKVSSSNASLSHNQFTSL